MFRHFPIQGFHHLQIFSENEKALYRTAYEISQVDILKLAAQRQQFIDQGQSLNLFVVPDTPPKAQMQLIMMAHELGLKTLYYNYSQNVAQKYNESLMTCTACDG